MLTSPDELKAKARDLLPPEVAGEVQSAIDAEVAERSDREIMAQPGAARTYSAATFYLADRLYAELGSGQFSGRPTVQWNGMDSFIFLEDAAHPFSYRSASGRVITPKRMTTDGGSIPRLLHALRKFSPWGYGPAFVIHDWLFCAHHKNQPPDNNWTFEGTATALAECMKSLMENGFTDADGAVQKLDKEEDTLYLIYQAVASGFAKSIWDGR